jgi:hypothetical protein
MGWLVIHRPRAPAGGATVIDLAYLAGSVLFFALMLGYVRVCERLGRTATAETTRQDESHT